MIQMKNIDSSHIADIKHEPETLTAHVTFNNGKVYHYHPVSGKDWQEWSNADSKGKYFHSRIKHLEVKDIK